ncbi:GyrI-like domain-containing protein [Mucilaginibacter pallidiroseus]|uniref:GyrI-like domain-containing protein n=1 Tax=Mucilaginibacter pallidiroseus TaxID=2599295 RepID=A0A563UEK4_9SPHI|nr:GyrI-like domain-containing protein [Mucilaginibacter pallidiroseus]TWR29788.1 GyrI-like domain-containing protein [Mucilaginibacter pallidiroseus]
MPQPILTNPYITTIAPKKLIGQYLQMSIAQNTTSQLWQTFMPLRKQINNAINADLICMQIYTDFETFTPDTTFEKWAAVEVNSFDNVPEGIHTFTLPGGQYAVFKYKGRARDFAPAFNYIFFTWLPQSAYELDSRPHFEVLGHLYKNDDPASEEDIWIPVKKRD